MKSVTAEGRDPPPYSGGLPPPDPTPLLPFEHTPWTFRLIILLVVLGFCRPQTPHLIMGGSRPPDPPDAADFACAVDLSGYFLFLSPLGPHIQGIVMTVPGRNVGSRPITTGAATVLNAKTRWLERRTLFRFSSREPHLAPGSLKVSYMLNKFGSKIKIPRV